MALVPEAPKTLILVSLFLTLAVSSRYSIRTLAETMMASLGIVKPNDEKFMYIVGSMGLGIA